MRSGLNHRRSGRRNGRNWHDGMAKHVDAVMKRAKERRTTLTNTSKRGFFFFFLFLYKPFLFSLHASFN